MDVGVWNLELSLFAKDLFANLMSRHPLLCTLPRTQGGSSYFIGEMGKCVMLKWHQIRNELDKKLRKDFPKFVKKEDCFKQYLKLFVDLVIQSEHNVMNQVFNLSAVLLGILCFVHRRGKTHFVHDASNYLLYMLFNIKPEEFYAGGGWALLATASKRLTVGYDEKEIRWQYLLANVCNCNASNLTVISKIDSTVKHSAETSSRITEKAFQEAAAISDVPEKEPGENSAKRNSDICGISTAIKSLGSHQTPTIPREDSSVILVSESINTDSKTVKEESMKNEENLVDRKLFPLEETEIHEVASESIKTSVKESSFQEEFVSSEELTERRMCDIEQSMNEVSKPTAKYIKNSAEDSVELKDSLYETLQSEPNQSDFKSTKENGSLDWITKKHDHISPSEKANNTADKPKLNHQVSAEQKGCDVDKLIRGEVNQISVESMNNVTGGQKKSAAENLDKIKVLPNGKVPACTKNENAKDGTKKNNSNHFKSPRHENSETFTSVKAKTPSSETYGIKDVKNKTTSPKNNRKATPLKTPTTRTPKTPPFVPSTGRNNIEKLTPKLLKPNSVEPKSKSPACLKTPTDRGLPKFQLKSSEKKDINRRLSLPKDSSEITKSSRSIFESAGNTKSYVKNVAAANSSKPLPPAIPKTKLCASNPPSNQMKSSSATSSSVPKCKVSAKDNPSACEKVKKNLQSSNLKTENVKEGTSLEKPLGMSSAKSDDPESKPDKNSKESSNNKTDVEEASRQSRKCEGNKGNKPPIASTRSANYPNTCRTRKVDVKSASGDSKNEKPRWR